MRAFWFSLTLMIGIVSAAALYAQVQFSGPNFWGLTNIQVKPAGQLVYRSLEELIGKEALFPRVLADLPVCDDTTEGNVAAVNDGLTNAWGDTVMGGGPEHILTYCNGSIWTVIGK